MSTIRVLSLILVAGTIACSGGSDDSGDPSGTDAGTGGTGGTDGGTDGGSNEQPDAGYDPAPTEIALRAGAAASATSNTITFAQPACTGLCPTMTYPDGEQFTQRLAVWDREDLLTIHVHRRMVQQLGSETIEGLLAMGFTLPRVGIGTVSCGAGGTGAIAVGDPASPLRTPKDACAFEVLENTQTRVRLEVKTAMVFAHPLGFEFTINPGVLDVPTKVATAAPPRGADGAHVVVGLTNQPAPNDRVVFNGTSFVEAEGKITLTWTGAIPRLTSSGIVQDPASLTLTVPSLALGAVNCGAGGRAEYRLTITPHQGNASVRSSHWGTTTCTLEVGANHATAFQAKATVTNGLQIESGGSAQPVVGFEHDMKLKNLN